MKHIDKEIMKSLLDRSFASKVTEITISDDITVLINDLIRPELIHDVVMSIVEGCFTEDGTYDPSKLEFLKRMAVLIAYTNIEFVDDIYEQYAFVYRSGVYESVVPYINQLQLNDIFDSVNDVIAYKKRASFANIETDMAKMYGELSTVVEQFRSMYSDVSGEDIKKLVGAIGNGKLDEKALVEAITDTKPDKKPVTKTVAKTTKKTATKK